MKKMWGALLSGALVVAGVFGLASPAMAATVYAYDGAREDSLSATALKANVEVGNPWLSSYEDHTLVELALQDTATGNILEIGVGRFNGGCLGTNVPRLFVYRWNGSSPGGYCDTSYTAVSNGAGYTRGMDMTSFVGTSPQLEIREVTSGGVGTGTWNFYLNNVNFGRFSSSAFTTAFTVANRAQAFGEIVSSTRAKTAMCTDEGLAPPVLASSTAGAQVSNINYLVGGVTTAANMATNGNTLTDPTAWNAVVVGGNTVRHGGPGYC